MKQRVIRPGKSYWKGLSESLGQEYYHSDRCISSLYPRGVLPYKILMGMCCWIGSHFHDWIGYHGVVLSIELLEWGGMFSDFFRVFRFAEFPVLFPVLFLACLTAVEHSLTTRAPLQIVRL